MRHQSLKVLVLVGALVMALPSVAQDVKPRSAGIIISVVERSDSTPKERPFANVGLFKLMLGDTAFPEGQCPSKSNSNGIAACRLRCEPDDATELNLVIRPPGSDVVPGYEVPVSQELTLVGCKLSETRVAFAYTPLELALRETLSADPELRNAVAINAPTLTFASLKPFEDSRQPLAMLIEHQPDNPNVARFARILHDASSSAAKTPTIAASTAIKVQKLSVGTQSIYMNAAVKRSLGPAKAGQIAPITTNPTRLRATTQDFTSALDKKPQKTQSEILLHKELTRVQSGTGKGVTTQPPKIEWGKVNREAGHDR